VNPARDPPPPGAFRYDKGPMDHTPRELAPPLQPHDLTRPIDFFGHAGAFVFDALTLFLLGFLPSIVIGGLAEFVRPAMRGALAHSVGWVLLFCTAGDIAFAASPGKWILGIVIRTPSGGPAPVWRLTVRWALKYSPILILLGAASLGEAAHFLDPSTPKPEFDDANGLAAFAAWLVILGSLLAILPARRTLHDWIAGTTAFVNVAHADALRHGFEVAPVADAPSQTPPASAAAPSDYPS